MLIVGSDSHTSTAGAFNAFAAGIDRTESAGIWKRGETWFRVPETIKITLTGKLKEECFCQRSGIVDYWYDRIRWRKLYVDRVSW